MDGSGAAIRDEILSTIQTEFGIRTHTYQENRLGFRNLKWRLETDQGPLFVKQYNLERYPTAKLSEVAEALTLQRRLHGLGFPCPELYGREERLIHFTPSGERFVLMGFCDGDLVRPGAVSEAQMESLGQTAARMHLLLGAHPVRRRPLHWDVPPRDEMLAQWRQRWEQVQAAADEALVPVMERQRHLIETFDFAALQACQPGWVHWDLWVDNLLFYPDRLAAVLDFDRMHWIYPDMDIGRGVLSGALANGKMRRDAVHAFVAGYRAIGGWEPGRLVRSLRLLWCLEIDHVRPLGPGASRPIHRFRDEMTWLTFHWDRLDELFDGL